MKPLDPELLRRSAAVRRHLVAAVLLGVATAAALIGQAWGLSALIAGRFDDEPVTAVAIAVVGIVVVRGLIGWAHTAAATRAAARVKAELRAEIMRDLLDPRRVGPRPSSARTVTLVGQGLDSLDAYVGRFLPQLVLAGAVPAAVVGVMLIADPWSGVIVALTVPLVVVFLVLVGLRTQDEVGRRWRTVDRLGRHFADVLDGIVLLKGFGRDQGEGLRRVGDRHREETVRSLRLAFTSAVALDLFSTLSVALVAVGVGLRVVHGGLDLATGLFVLLLAPEAFAPIRRLGAHFHDSTEGADAIAAVMQVLNHSRHEGTLAAPDPRTSALRVVGLEVTHDDRERAAVRIEHAELEPGAVTAVTGPSGSGKSTLLSVLLGLELPARGRVEIGGIDLAEIDPEAWCARLAWVPQVPGLIDGTIADNVRLGLSASDRDVERALVDAGAADLAPHRHVGEGGSNVSAGERRRIAVARAILRVRVAGAGLVLLDEPTAGLDAEREDTVLATLRAFGATVVVVTHRPSTLRAADRIVPLKVPEPAS